MNKKKIKKGKAQLCSLENNSQIVTVNTGLKWCGLCMIFSHKTGSERRKKNQTALTLGTRTTFKAALDRAIFIFSVTLGKFASQTSFLLARVAFLGWSVYPWVVLPREPLQLIQYRVRLSCCTDGQLQVGEWVFCTQHSTSHACHVQLMKDMTRRVNLFVHFLSLSSHLLITFN